VTKIPKPIVHGSDHEPGAVDPTRFEWEDVGGDASGGLIVQDEGLLLPLEHALNFIGTGVTATDDPANSRTNVTIPGAAALPGYTQYTPRVWCSTTNPVGFTCNGQWLKIGPMVHVDIGISYQFGSGHSVGVGQYFVEIPFGPLHYGLVGSGFLVNGGNIPDRVQPLWADFTNTPAPPPVFVSLAYPATWPGGNVAHLTDSLPWTWGSPTLLHLNCLYRWQ
jgi:hypothetical protein